MVCFFVVYPAKLVVFYRQQKIPYIDVYIYLDKVHPSACTKAGVLLLCRYRLAVSARNKYYIQLLYYIINRYLRFMAWRTTIGFRSTL